MIMVVVVKECGKCRVPIAVYDTYTEAVNFCEYLDWEIIDENQIEWGLAIITDGATLWNLIPKD
jgi:hypothetical protein